MNSNMKYEQSTRLVGLCADKGLVWRDRSMLGE